MPAVPRSVRPIAYALAAVLLSNACSAGTTEGAAPPLIGESSTAALGSGSPLKHIVIIVQESWTLNNMFTGWPNAIAPSLGMDYLHELIPLKVMKYAQDRSMCELLACMILAGGLVLIASLALPAVNAARIAEIGPRRSLAA
jgi:hypothetical protein